MLPSKSRLTKDEVAEVFKKGSRVSNQYASLIFLRQRPKLKAAAVVSKKVSGSAVVRNKIRRRIYSAIESISSSMHPSHIAILAGKGVVESKGKELEAILKDLIQKARISQ